MFLPPPLPPPPPPSKNKYDSSSSRVEQSSWAEEERRGREGLLFSIRGWMSRQGKARRVVVIRILNIVIFEPWSERLEESETSSSPSSSFQLFQQLLRCAAMMMMVFVVIVLITFYHCFRLVLCLHLFVSYARLCLIPIYCISWSGYWSGLNANSVLMGRRHQQAELGSVGLGRAVPSAHFTVTNALSLFMSQTIKTDSILFLFFARERNKTSKQSRPNNKIR